MLDLSKIEAGELKISLNDYSMRDIVDGVISDVGSLAAEKNLTLNAIVPPDLPTGLGDDRRIAQVLLNLVGNAIKFTDEGEVSVRVSASDGAFQVAVADTGIGISEADQAEILNEFYQADSSSTRAQGGTGLGLAIAKRMGNEKKNVEPSPRADSIDRRPPCSSTIRLAIARPRPVPPCARVLELSA